MADFRQGVRCVRYTFNRESGSFVLAKRQPSEKTLFFPPMPGEWLLKAARLPGRALAIACLIRLEAAFIGRPTITLQNKWAERAGLNRYAKARALRELEKAGLIKVEWNRGSNALVTVLER